VREELLHFFQRNKQIAEQIVNKVADTQQLRKELQEVKKLARERAKAITLRIPQLKDCKNHFDKKKEKGKDTMVFICEGQSAAGSITSCRDVNNQAVFVLKGKPLNVWDLKRDVMYKNDEMYNLMQALNVEDNTEGVRYEKVILATDADVDGMHIRNLMITYFFRFFEQLVHDGHVYVLETPLFRVRNKEKTIYCYSESERDNAVKELGGKPEITRFKGLGEISPKEFAQFIGKEMRLSKVEYAPRAESGPIFNFYMGKNTPERKDYIMENLVVPVLFVPGIMGTRLKVKNRDASAWYPPENTWDGLVTVLKHLNKSAADRQKLLDPNNTEVDDEGPAHPDESSKALLAIAPGDTDAERAKWRGWGQLYGKSYAGIL